MQYILVNLVKTLIKLAEAINNQINVQTGLIQTGRCAGAWGLPVRKSYIHQHMAVCDLYSFDVFTTSKHVHIFPTRVVLFLTFDCVVSLLQVWPLTPGIWTTTHPCSRRLKGTLPVWSVSTWLSPIGEAHWDCGLWHSCVWVSWVGSGFCRSLTFRLFAASTVVTGFSGGAWW